MRGKTVKRLNKEGISKAEYKRTHSHLSEQKPKFKNYGIRKSQIKKAGKKARRPSIILG